RDAIVEIGDAEARRDVALAVTRRCRPYAGRRAGRIRPARRLRGVVGTAEIGGHLRRPRGRLPRPRPARSSRPVAGPDTLSSLHPQHTNSEPIRFRSPRSPRSSLPKSPLRVRVSLSSWFSPLDVSVAGARLQSECHWTRAADERANGPGMPRGSKASLHDVD